MTVAEPIITEGGTSHDKGEAWKPENIKAFENTKDYLDKGVAWVIPTRGNVPMKVIDSWDTIQWPMNQPRTPRLSAIGMEVAAAYEYLFRLCTDDEFAQDKLGAAFRNLLSKMNFILTVEEDNVIPPNAVNDLFYALYTCIDCGKQIDLKGTDGRISKEKFDAWRCPDGHKGLDGVGGLYWTKTIPSRPMAYGDPKEGDDYKPVSVTDAITDGRVLEVNGIAMGCTLFRKALFSKVTKPWFKTEQNGTQDLLFCGKAKKEIGARFAVHCGVRVGHLDTSSGELY